MTTPKDTAQAATENTDNVERIGALLHASCIGKVIQVPWLSYYLGVDSQDHAGPFLVRILPMDAKNLRHWNHEWYDPDWDCEPLPGQGLPPEARSFWCSAVSCNTETGRWELKFELQAEPAPTPPPKKYAVRMSAMACVRGTYRTEADSPAHAEQLAKEHSGDVQWKYEGTEEDDG